MGKNKKEKVVDLKPENISQEDLTQLQRIVSAINKLQFDIGTLEAQKHGALHALFEGNEKLNEIQSSFKEKYGTDNINISSGAINYEDNEPSNS